MDKLCDKGLIERVRCENDRRVVYVKINKKGLALLEKIKMDDFENVLNNISEKEAKILNELLRTSSIVFYNIQIVTGSKKAFFKIIGELSDYLKDIIVWDKNYAQPAMAKKVLNRRTELILVFDSKNAISRQFKTANFNRGTLDDIWQIARGKKITGSHSAVFPEELAKTIIENFSNEGDVVYDPFMGTGTTARMAKTLNRKYIGSEISKEYCDIIDKRLNTLL
jgi:site-specific DNA-methyltransferase (adenine-specific)/modification methylase